MAFSETVLAVIFLGARAKRAILYETVYYVDNDKNSGLLRPP